MRVSARIATYLVGVNRNTAIPCFHRLRELFDPRRAEEDPFLADEVEFDESCFVGVQKGKRGRGAAGKITVFGLLKRGVKWLGLFEQFGGSR